MPKKNKTKKGGNIVLGSDGLPHNETTGWHFASQPAPIVQSLSYGVENREFSQMGGGKVNIKGIGMRKVRYYKNGNKYVMVNKKKIKI